MGYNFLSILEIENNIHDRISLLLLPTGKVIEISVMRFLMNFHIQMTAYCFLQE